MSAGDGDDDDVATERSAFERGKEAGERNATELNPFENGSPDYHHFETGRKFGTRAGKGGRSPYWQRRKT